MEYLKENVQLEAGKQNKMTILENFLQSLYTDNRSQANEWGGVDVKKEKTKVGHAIIMKASEIEHSLDKKCQAGKNSNILKCRCSGLKGATTYLKSNIGRCKGDTQCIQRVKKYIENNVSLINNHCKKAK